MLRARPLTAAAFAPFGDVIALQADPRIINYGHTERHHDLAPLDCTADGGRTVVSIFRSTPLPEPLALTVMERHPRSSQTFVPLDGRPYLVVVAPVGELDPEAIVAFLARGDQGVSYRRGTWHHFCLALQAVSRFLVIDREADDDDCDEVRLTEPLTVQWR